MNACDIIIPSWNLPQFLIPCVQSIIAHTAIRDALKIIVVNNGDEQSVRQLPKHDMVKVVSAGKNLGWEGGLKLGLQHSSSEFVCFMNDDTFIPFSSHYWANYCLQAFSDQNVAAVGPTSNCVSGLQNMFFGNDTANPYPSVANLIGFCMFVRRKHLDEVGGVDDKLPGGDDLDLCIRFRRAGYKLKLCRPSFVYHHGFKSGERLKGGPDKPGGWNSREMIERTNHALIQKHGFRRFIENQFGAVPPDDPLERGETEKEIVRSMLKDGKMVEMGCGGDKVVETVIGVDRIPKGETVPHMNGVKSLADYTADVSKPLPLPDGEFDCVIARHILEHCVDTVSVLKNWIRLLKPDGRLLISVPDQRWCNSIPLNPEHVHAWSPEALDNLMGVFGFKCVETKDRYNGIAFTSAFERATANVQA